MKLDDRKLMAIAIVALFALAFWNNPNSGLLIGALIARFGDVSNFWFGTTKTGSETATKNADAVTQALKTNSTPTQVEVVNDEKSPVPVEPR